VRPVRRAVCCLHAHETTPAAGEQPDEAPGPPPRELAAEPPGEPADPQPADPQPAKPADPQPGEPQPGEPAGPSPVCPAEQPGADLPVRISHLYECHGLSSYRIAAIVGISQQRVNRALHRNGVVVKPKGAGRPRRQGPEVEALIARMEHLYVRLRLTSGQVAALTGVPQRTVRSRLAARGVQLRTRGPHNREDRVTVPADVLARLYAEAGLPAAEIGRLFGVSGRVVLRAAHDQGFAVRVGGPEPREGPAEIELIEALYADRAVRRCLERHGISQVPPGAPIWQRFGVPVPLGPELATELYESCGLSLRHIELLTGHPAETVRALLRGCGVARRPRGARSPFLRRWRAGG
jgi:hypothetical protein